MLSFVRFRRKKYKLVVTNHARNRMQSRDVSRQHLLWVLENGSHKKKPTKDNKFWVYDRIENRDDNMVCFSIAIEEPNLIVVTALINWSPDED